jgi:translation elongation factor P/translation initiation factor 5A
MLGGGVGGALAASELRVGNTVEMDGKLFVVHEIGRSMKGRGSAYVHLSLRDVNNGAKKSVRMKGSDIVSSKFTLFIIEELMYLE